MSSFLTSRRPSVRRLLSVRPLAFAASFALIAGCYEHANAPEERLISAVPSGSVQIVVQQESSSGDELTLVARVVGNDVKVGAYQGEVTFVPGTLELLGIETPTVENELHIANPSSFAQGRIRFAAYTTASAFTSSEAFRIRVKAVHSLADATFVGKLEVVGEPTGHAVSKTKLLASRGIRDATTNQLIIP
jgi:hypothetical protein